MAIGGFAEELTLISIIAWINASQPGVAFVLLYILVGPRGGCKPGRLKCTTFFKCRKLKKKKAQILKLPKSLVYSVSEHRFETLPSPEELLRTSVISKEGFTVS